MARTKEEIQDEINGLEFLLESGRIILEVEELVKRHIESLKRDLAAIDA